MSNSEIDTDEILIDCQSLWKIFGSNASAARQALTESDLTKQEILQKFNCVVGVSGVDLQVRRGEIFCIMGLSGSGKSTLLRLLNRLITPSSGRTMVKGRDMSELGPSELREMRAHHIGMVFQSVALLPHRTVLDNTAFGLEVQGVGKEKRNQIAGDALATVGLADWVERYPTQLSGGMQQRVGLARAIATDPEIILMDEPFSALDPLLRRQLQDEFRPLIKELGKSAVFITHDLDEAIRMGDRIAIMKDGVIIQVGTAEEIVQAPADAYVEKFVAGISTHNFIKAQGVMCSVEAFRTSHPDTRVGDLAQVSPDTDADELMDRFATSVHDALAVVDDTGVIGVVTARRLLAGMKGKQQKEQSAAA